MPSIGEEQQKEALWNEAMQDPLSMLRWGSACLVLRSPSGHGAGQVSYCSTVVVSRGGCLMNKDILGFLYKVAA